MCNHLQHFWISLEKNLYPPLENKVCLVFDIDELDVEDEGGAGRNDGTDPRLAVRQVRRYHQGSLLT